MAVKKIPLRPIAKPPAEVGSPWKKMEFGATGKEQRQSVFDIKQLGNPKHELKAPKPFNPTGRVAVPIPEESEEIKLRRTLSGMIREAERKSVPPPPALRTVRETMRINRAECEIYDGEISIVENDDYFELSSEDIEEIKSITTFKETGFFKTVLRDIEDLLNKFEKTIDDILKL
jgi:hypothetical protein